MAMIACEPRYTIEPHHISISVFFLGGTSNQLHYEDCQLDVGSSYLCSLSPLYDGVFSRQDALDASLISYFIKTATAFTIVTRKIKVPVLKTQRLRLSLLSWRNLKRQRRHLASSLRHFTVSLLMICLVCMEHARKFHVFTIRTVPLGSIWFVRYHS